MKNIFVGNLSFSTTEDDVRQAFEPHGAVDRVSIVTDRDTGRSRGFAFVEMADDRAAETAIQALNGTDLNGRTLNVNEARPREPRSSGGFGGNRGGGGGGGNFNRNRGGNSRGGRDNRW